MFFLDVSIKPYCSKAGQDWGQKGSVSGQCGLGLRADRMRNWIFLPTLFCVFSTTGMLGESLGVRRRGKAAQYWNITSSTHIRSTRDADSGQGTDARSFPIALPPGSLFSVSLFLFPKVTAHLDRLFQLFFEIAINVFNYNEEVSQNILLDFPITYVIPTPGFRSFSTSRGDLIGKLEEIGDRWVK